MDTKEVIEGNRIIAEFMGLKYDDHDEKWHDGKYFATDSLLYNTDWSRLMPVVEKIESKGYGVIIEKKSSIIHEVHPTMQNKSWEKRNGNKIENTWLAVIEFIKWYNQSK